MLELFSVKAENFLELVSVYGIFWFYIFIFASTLFDNLFPPYPGDTVIFVGGYLAGLGRLSFPLVVIIACGGSLAGAMILYYLGRQKGRGIFLKDKGRILNRNQLEKIENWFARYGEKVIIISRFLTGIRSGVALSAGVGNLSLRKMAIYSLISIFAWNGLIVLSASLVQKNWQNLYQIIQIYNKVVLVLVFVIVVIWVIRFLRKKPNQV